MKPFLLFSLVLLTALASGCATRSAPEKRIENNRPMYDPLNEEEQNMVRSGTIREGMNKDAVFLAWGSPDKVLTGSRDGIERETWQYFLRTPVHGASVGFGTGGYSDFGYGIGSDVDFVREMARVVEYENGRVVAWQRLR
jgi:hypothetical protein